MKLKLKLLKEKQIHCCTNHLGVSSYCIYLYLFTCLFLYFLLYLSSSHTICCYIMITSFSTFVGTKCIPNPVMSQELQIPHWPHCWWYSIFGSHCLLVEQLTSLDSLVQVMPIYIPTSSFMVHAQLVMAPEIDAAPDPLNPRMPPGWLKIFVVASRSIIMG